MYGNLEVTVQATINSLGYLEDGVYYPEPDCFENIRDLISFLRNDTSDRITRRLCGERNIVGCDLIPIMKGESTPEMLFDAALRLAVNLCQPVLAAFGGRKPDGASDWAAHYQVEKNLSATKRSFADADFFSVLKNKAAEYFALEWVDRREDKRLIVERIMALVFYVLLIEDSDPEDESTAVDVSNHDAVLMALFESGFVSLLIEVSSTPAERDFHLRIMEVFALMVMHQDAQNVADAGVNRSNETRNKNEDELRKFVEIEKEKLLEKRRHISSRHSKFAGSYVMKGMKALNREKDMVTNKVLTKVGEIEYLDKRKVLKRPKNRRPFDTKAISPKSPLSLRIMLREFSKTVLERCYNALMSSCKDTAFSGRKTLTQNNSDSHYFQLMRFMMEFRRCTGLSADHVESTLGIEAFHHVQTQLDNYIEFTRIERNDARIHALRAQSALAAYKELLQSSLDIMKTGNEEWKKEIEEVCEHILKVEEYRDLSNGIIRKYNPGIFSKTFLRDVILSNHMYISLVEKYSKAGLLSKVVKRKKIRKRAPKALIETKKLSISEDFDLLNLWGEISEELSEMVLGHIEPTKDICVIDVLMIVSDEMHQRFAMLRVQRALRERRIADAVGLYRIARSLWPADDIFGAKDIAPEDEFLELHAIFFSDLKEVEEEYGRCYEQAYGKEMANETNDEAIFDSEEDEHSDVGDDESSLDGSVDYVEKEINFRFEEYVLKFARKSVLKWYVFLLADFETNSADVNKAILKLLHRIAFDLKLMSRLYQLSLFYIFYQLGVRFNKKSLNEIKKSEHFELYQFGYHLLKKFFATYKKVGSKLIPEILFWKGTKECFEIDYGYGSYEVQPNGRKGKEKLWSEELDNEIRTLYEEYLSCETRIDEVDVVDYIEQNLSRPRTRKQIMQEMKSLGLDTFGLKMTKSFTQGGLQATTFNPEAKELLVHLVEQFNLISPSKRTDDLIDFIREQLPEYSRARIIKQLQYQGVEYGTKKKKRMPRRQAWPEALVQEMLHLKDEYLTTEKAKSSIVNFICNQLSIKKPRGEIADELREHGVNPDAVTKQKSPRKRTNRSKGMVQNEESEDQVLSQGILDGPGPGSEDSDPDISDVDLGRNSEPTDNLNNDGVDLVHDFASDENQITRENNEGSSDSDDEILLKRKHMVTDKPASNDDVDKSYVPSKRKRRIMDSDSE